MNSNLMKLSCALLAAATLSIGGVNVAAAKGGHSDHGGKSAKGSDSGKHREKHAEKDKSKNCGIVPMAGCGGTKKDPVGNTKPTLPGGNGGTTAGNNPPPAAPPSNVVVRDHRPGGNAAGTAPGTIIRDHRDGSDGKPVVVVSSGPGGTVTRPATQAELQKAGLAPKPGPTTVVPIGALGGGR